MGLSMGWCRVSRIRTSASSGVNSVSCWMTSIGHKRKRLTNLRLWLANREPIGSLSGENATRLPPSVSTSGEQIPEFRSRLASSHDSKSAVVANYAGQDGEPEDWEYLLATEGAALMA
jgi:hypothetical protein